MERAGRAGVLARQARGESMAKKNDKLHAELEAFVEEHPQGWGHTEWSDLLGRLSDRGFDVKDVDRIGLDLERARLSAELERRQIQGLGPKRREALAERFNTLWNLRQATTDEIEEIPTIPRAIAERIQEALR